MRITITDKLSDMVAHYENLLYLIGMIFEFEHLLRRVEALERKVINTMDKIYWQKKTLSVTLNDINNCSKVRAEEQDIDKLGKVCSERKTCRQKWLATSHVL